MKHKKLTKRLKEVLSKEFYNGRRTKQETDKQYIEPKEIKFVVVLYIMFYYKCFSTSNCSYFILKLFHVKLNHNLLIRPDVLPLDYKVFIEYLQHN